EGKFKVPSKNLVRFLSQRGDISPDLERDIDALIDARHLVIHRWGGEKGFSHHDDDEGWHEYEAASVRVELEATRITRLLVDYLQKWTAPEWVHANAEEYVERIRRLFRAT